ncbi:CDP-alcohol phosphatidyltransferase family protein [Paenibacillus sp. UNC451MF]|uniref:CDP-alcohol phosphatidyltransferase family protein n=1 Tax=Paenibacillus sp. UNC451MF TaxID=1449063 RepID=UPI00068D67D1|nr:CDP-alcohol phosphatidyltransferase family protein [Paenibacillus sp. UNC451MF]
MVQSHKLSSWIAVIIIAREMIITGIRIVAAGKRIALAADRYGKIKLVVQVAAVTAVILNNQPFQWWIGIPVDQILMYGAAAITIYSGFNYIRSNMKRLELHL